MSKDSDTEMATIDPIDARKASSLSKSTDFKISGGLRKKAAIAPAGKQQQRKSPGRNKEEEQQKIKENLSLEVKNYQRKTLLSGIGQQETLGEHYDLV